LAFFAKELIVTRVLLQLTGGLGNQLFQLAAGLSLVSCESNKLEIEEKLGRPRGTVEGTPDVLSFDWPEPFKIVPVRVGKLSNFMSRVTGYCLRLGVIPTKIESSKVIHESIISIASLLLSLFLKERRKIFIGQGTGFTELDRNLTAPYLVGYFQSYRYAELSRSLLSMAKISKAGPELTFLESIARVETPLVVHCRFGDYLQEEDFGIPSSKYYSSAIEKLLERNNFNCIWVFSDDLEKAKEKLSLVERLPVRWINSVDASVASTLQAMRLGHGYVVANSSFSWWAAFLSVNSAAEVVAPSPWFKGMDDPKDLIPLNWHQVDAGYVHDR
jgi:hypothetical protein